MCVRFFLGKISSKLLILENMKILKVNINTIAFSDLDFIAVIFFEPVLVDSIHDLSRTSLFHAPCRQQVLDLIAIFFTSFPVVRIKYKDLITQ